MTKSDSDPQLPGSDKVREWFGEWPSFHDAEVISLTLSRSGDSVLRIYPYAPANPATVEFLLNGITDLELWDFSIQNVISDLDVEQVKRKNGDVVFRLQMGPCFGLAGHIDANKIRVAVTPGKPPDGISLW